MSFSGRRPWNANDIELLICCAIPGDRFFAQDGMFSLCAPVSESFFRRVLELNGDVPHDAVPIQDVDRQPYCVMRNCYPRATYDPDELRGIVLTIAHWAYEVEKLLTAQKIATDIRRLEPTLSTGYPDGRRNVQFICAKFVLLLLVIYP